MHFISSMKRLRDETVNGIQSEYRYGINNSLIKTSRKLMAK